MENRISMTCAGLKNTFANIWKRRQSIGLDLDLSLGFPKGGLRRKEVNLCG